jgi:hypothetical protein
VDDRSRSTLGPPFTCRRADRAGRGRPVAVW